jgi:hypothetical protein
MSPAKEQGIRALRQCASVDFPDPDWPAIRTFCPGYILRLIFLSVGCVCARYLKETSENSIIGDAVFKN